MLEEASFMELELFREDLYLTGKLLVLQVAPVLFQNVGDLKLSFGCCHVYLAVIRNEFAPRGCLCYRVSWIFLPAYCYGVMLSFLRTEVTVKIAVLDKS
jgi:hypothetical protein